jgi:Beta-lactamase
VLAEVRTGDRQLRGTSGVADLDSRQPVNGNGFFRIGSNTKTFLSVVVLQLVAEHRLSLDDTVGHWLPGVVHGNGNDGYWSHEGDVPGYNTIGAVSSDGRTTVALSVNSNVDDRYWPPNTTSSTTLCATADPGLAPSRGSGRGPGRSRCASAARPAAGSGPPAWAPRRRGRPSRSGR